MDVILIVNSIELDDSIVSQEEVKLFANNLDFVQVVVNFQLNLFP